MKRDEAKISCSPAKPCWGKWGDSAQISSGTLAMRVSVMELGRFTGDRAGHSHSVTGGDVLLFGRRKGDRPLQIRC